MLTKFLCLLCLLCLLRSGPALRHAALEIRCFVDASRALVFSDLRIGAQWTSAIDFPAGAVRCLEPFRGFAFLHLLLERTDFVQVIKDHPGVAATIEEIARTRYGKVTKIG